MLVQKRTLKFGFEMHKSIRKYAKFNPDKLDDLIEISSYDLIETTTDFTIAKQYKFVLDGDFSPHEITKLETFKHKFENSHLIAIHFRYATIYYYVNSAKTQNRVNKPKEVK